MGKNNGGFLLGAVIGGAAAAVAALLMAPKTGEETRKDLKNQLDDLKEMSEDYTKIAKEKSGEVLSKAQDLKETTLSSLKKHTEQLSDDLEQTVADSDWESRLDNLVDDAQDIVLDVDDMSQKTVDSVKETASEVKDSVQTAVEEQPITEDITAVKDEVVDTAGDVKDDIVSAAKETAQDIKEQTK